MKKTIVALILALTVFSGVSFASGKSISIFIAYTGIDEIMGEFTKDTGIAVNYLRMSSGEVLARLRAAKGKAVADAWFGGGVDSYIAAGNEGLLDVYVSPEASAIPSQYKDSDGKWTGISLVAVDFIVNTDVLKEKKIVAPRSWADLLNPVYKGEILMPNPTISGTAYAMVAHILQTMGEEKGWAYLKALDANIPYYTKRGGGAPTQAAMGEAAIGLAPYDSGEKVKKEGYPVESIFPSDGSPSFLTPVAIIKGAKNPEGAKALVDWVLSVKGQETIMKYCPKLGTRPGVTVPQELEQLSKANLRVVDTAEAGKNRKAVTERWKEEFGNKESK